MAPLFIVHFCPQISPIFHTFHPLSQIHICAISSSASGGKVSSKATEGEHEGEKLKISDSNLQPEGVKRRNQSRRRLSSDFSSESKICSWSESTLEAGDDSNPIYLSI